MFTHVEVRHIGFNMLALWVLGPAARARHRAGPGSWRSTWSPGSPAARRCCGSPRRARQTLGASGRDLRADGRLLVVAIKVHGDVRGMLTWIGINFVITFVFVGVISWQGHLGGLLGGLLLGAACVYAPRERRTVWQTAGVVAVAVLVRRRHRPRIAQLA